ncbi:hypothetical protein KY289_028189 [Solanum tuberosum]|nr:hypothetical protein KY289_028189 [Solanum tuberosum]KAH0663054.1 hypothetical protein KY284_027985 [Solanum tuberosum]
MADSSVTMKLLIDTKRKRVVFAEAGKECVDFLFHILALPIGSVIRLLTTKQMVGCLGNLYESLENLDNMYIQPNQEKDILLKPKSAQGAGSAPLLIYPSLTLHLYNSCIHALIAVVMWLSILELLVLRVMDL